MVRPKKKESVDEKRAKDRARKKQKYIEIKNDPERYRIYQEKEKQRYLLKKAKKQVLSIQQMTERGKREQRKRWRKYNTTYRKKKEDDKKNHMENEIDVHEPPAIVPDPLAAIGDDRPATPLNMSGSRDIDVSSRPETTANISIPSKTSPKQTSSLVRKLRYRTQRVINDLKNSVAVLARQNKMLQKRCQRLETEKNIYKTSEDSMEKEVNRIIKDIREDKVTKVKRQLLFNESMTRGVRGVYEGLKKTEKRPFLENLTKDQPRLKDHKIASKIPFQLKKKLLDQKKKGNQTKRQVKEFFEEDCNSQIAAGKKEYIKHRGIRKQKRYLTDNLKNLHDKYCRSHGRISYSNFCQSRPFWVVYPSNNQRDTCLCKIHINVEFLIKALKQAEIINEATPTEIIKSLCCDINNETCLGRECVSCKDKVLRYKEFDDSKTIVYYEWNSIKKSYVGRDGKTKYMIGKDKLKKEDTPRKIIQKLETALKTFFRHVLNIHAQYVTVKEKKLSLSDNEIICHIDFSENYNYKYNEEIQDFHFGGSRGQASLHTGVLYYKNADGFLITKSFCSMSQCLDHNASSIWAHLIPVMKIAQECVPFLTKIHFVSDSPSSQYRNRFVFYMMTQLKKQIPDLEIVTWNYQESGHGKGAPDGIGAVVKRTADRHVKFGGDVGCFQDFVRIIQQNVKTVEIIIIEENEIKMKKFPETVPVFKGTLKVHQAVWSALLPECVAFRSLSCFVCENSYLPCEHNKHLGVLSMGSNQTTVSGQQIVHDDEEVENVNFENDHLGTGSMQIDTPTLMKNIGDNYLEDFERFCDDSNMILSEFDGTMLTKDTVEKTKVVNVADDEIFLSEVDGSMIVKDSLVSQCDAYKTAEKYTHDLDAAKKPSKVKILADITLKGPSHNSVEIDYITESKKTLNMSEMHTFSDQFNIMELDQDNINLGELDGKEKFESEHDDYITEKKEISDLKAIKRYSKEYFSARVPKTGSERNGHDVAYRHLSETLKSEDLNKENLIDLELEHSKYDEDTWVAVEYKVKNKKHIYIGKIIKVKLETQEYKILFVKKAQGKSIKFSWPTISDEDIVSKSHIVQVLEDPVETRRGQFIFNNLPKFKFK